MICPNCGNERGIGLWPFCPHGVPKGSLSPKPVHRSEAAVVYRHPGTGHIRYPGRNDTPMPERYRRQGYEYHSLNTLHSLDSFCREQGVVNEKANFDSNGKGLDVGE